MRRTWIAIALAAGLWACGSDAPEPEAKVEAPPPPPNIVLILADDLGYGDLGSYGQTRIQTPVLDQMAREGLRFTDFHSGSTVCAPSRGALMTGFHTGHAVVRGNREVKPMGQHPLPPESVTIAEVLRNKGYQTALIGKWGLGGPDSTGEPNLQGFDYFCGYLCQRHAHNSYPEFLFRNRDRFPLANVLPEPKREDGAGVSTQKYEYSGDLLMHEAVDFIDRSAGAGPFFLAFTPTIPHANNEGGKDGMEVPDLGPYADMDWPERQKQHASMITRLDTGIGRLMRMLGQKGVAENTLVLFSSDNGPHAEGGNDPEFNNSNGPLRGIKRDLYEGGVRVPLIAVWPGHTPAGQTSDYLGAFWDLLPTFAEIAGAPPPAETDGISMVPVLTGHPDEQPQHEFLYWEFHEGKGSKQAVRMGKWKGVKLTPDGPLELYDVSDDIGEQSNVADAHQDVVAKIEDYLKTARTESEFWPLKSPGR
ncbi:MAG: arylsulfatase [Bryobacterales bacterium]|nr:arylsulfatase [Acidobacteriota bacterium]MCB9385022.1 arylsulfatase [Bryobacterales bacterium]